MKRKGITIWEQHLEHFVIGAAVLFFVVFTALQFMREPNAIDRAPDGKITPGQVDGLLTETAEQISARLDPDSRPEIDIPEHHSVHEDFLAALRDPVSPVARIKPSTRRVVIAPLVDTGAAVAYVMPEIDAPYSVVVEQHFDSIAGYEVDNIPGLKEMFPERPYDLSWMTVGALFDVSRVLETYQRAGPDGGSPIPVNWYRNRIDVLDVKVEREEYLDGVWGNRVTLDPMPGRVTLRDRLSAEGKRSSDVDAILSSLDPGVANEIIQPPFYDTRNGTWTEPNPRIEEEEITEDMSEDDRQALTLVNRINKNTAKRQQTVEKLLDLGVDPDKIEEKEEPEEEKAGGRERPGDEGDRGGRGSGGSSGKRAPPGARKPPGGRGGSGFGGVGDQDTGPSAAEQQGKIDNLRRKLEQIDRVLRRDRAALLVLRPEAEVAAEEEADAAELVVWAHDIAVQPRTTYRYRFTIELYNPFYAKKLSLVEDQRYLAERITIQSQPSAWSEPEQSIPDRKVWITKAYGPGERNAGTLGLGQAWAEVFRFYEGRWWMDTFVLEPGDYVGGLESLRRDADAPGPSEIDFGTDWFVLDIVGDTQADKLTREQGRGARVVLMNMIDESVIVIGDPLQTIVDTERQQLKEAVEEADLAEGMASAG